MRRMKLHVSLLIILLSLFTAVRSWGGNRDLLSLGGVLFDSSGTIVNGTETVTFRLYDGEGASSPLWEETETVVFEDGIYSVILGDGTSFQSDLFDADSLFLGIQIQGEPEEMTPRMSLFSVPWSMQAEVATTALSLKDSVVTSASIASEAVTTTKIADGTITNADIGSSAGIAWSKISKSGAVAGDVGAAASIHTHAAGDITGTITAGIFRGTGSTTDAIDLGTTEVSGTLALSGITDGGVTTQALFAGGGGGPGYRAIADGDVPNNITIDQATSATTANALAANGSNCAAGQYARGVDASGNAENCTATIADGMPHAVFSRRFAYVHQNLVIDTSFTNVAVANLGTSGTATAQASLSGATRSYIQFASNAVANSLAGIGATSYIHTRPNYRPKVTAQTRTDSATDTRRVWVGLFEDSPQLLAPTTGSAATGIDYIGVGFDTSVDANWLCCSGDGTNHSCTSTGVAVAASTEYTLTVDWTVEGTLTCTVNGTSVDKTTNLSTNAVDLGIYASMATLDATSRNFQLAKFMLEQN